MDYGMGTDYGSEGRAEWSGVKRGRNWDNCNNINNKNF